MSRRSDAKALAQAGSTVTQIGLGYRDGQQVPVAKNLVVTVHGTPGFERTVTVTDKASGREIGTLTTDVNGNIQQ
jgi:hypothetical protein